MDALWIILIAVLLVAVIAGCLIVRRYETREKAWQIVEAAKAEKKADADAVEDAKGKRPNIPVWRDKPTGIKE